MKEKKRARLKALVVAFILVFAGFAALMTIPGPSAATDGPVIEVANEIMVPYDGAALNEGNDELLQEGDWYWMYEGAHRPPAETSIGFDVPDPIMWAYAMIPDIDHINAGEINAVAIYEMGAHPADKYISVREGGLNGTEVANYTYTPSGTEGWYELEFDEPAEVEADTEYAVVVHVYDDGTGHFPAGCVSPAVEEGDWTWDDEDGWGRLSDYGLDYSWLLELRIFSPPTIATRDATDHTIDSVLLNATYTMGAEDVVEVYFEYALQGEPWIEVGREIFTEAGYHNYVLEGLDQYEMYEYRGVVEYIGEIVNGTVREFIISPLTVTVVDSEDGTPIQGAWVSLYSDEPLWEKGFETDANGELLYIHSVPIEETSFNYSASKIWDYVTVEGNFTGPEYTIELPLRTEWPVIVGPILFEEEGEEYAVDYAEVFLDGIFEPVYSNVQGEAIFDVGYDPTGESFEASITHLDYNPKTVQFTVDDIGVGSGPIYLEQEVFDFTIGPIVNEDGDPLENVEVYATLEVIEPLWWEQGVTGADGTVSFSAVHFIPSETELYLGLTDLNGIYLTRPALALPDETIVMEVRPQITVGPVVNRMDRPVEGIRVDLLRQLDEYDVGFNYTDSEGMIRFTVDFPIPDAEHFLANVSHPELEDGYVLWDFQGADSPTIKISVGPYGRIQIGPIKDNFNQFVPGAMVTLYRDGVVVNIEEANEHGIAAFLVEYDPAGIDLSYRITHPDLDAPATGDFLGTHSGEIIVDIGEEPVDPVDPPEPKEEEISTTLLAGIGLLIIIIIIIIVIVMMKKKPGEEPLEEEEEPLFDEEEEPLFDEEEEPLFDEEEEPLFDEEEEPLFEEEEEPLFEEEEEPLFEEEEEF